MAKPLNRSEKIAIFGLIIAVFGWSWWGGLFSWLSSPSENQTAVPATKVLNRSVFSLYRQTNWSAPLLEVEEEWSSYSGLIFKHERATIFDYGFSGQDKIWVTLRGVSPEDAQVGYVTCLFSKDWEQRIRLEKSTETSFSGTINGNLADNRIPIATGCELESSK